MEKARLVRACSLCVVVGVSAIVGCSGSRTMALPADSGESAAIDSGHSEGSTYDTADTAESAATDSGHADASLFGTKACNTNSDCLAPTPHCDEAVKLCVASCAPTGWITEADGCEETCPSPICGTDHKIYPSACLAPWGANNSCCPAGALFGYFCCSGRYCREGEEMCLASTGMSPRGRCMPLPSACLANPSCGCLVPQDYACPGDFWTCVKCSVESGNITLSANFD